MKSAKEVRYAVASDNTVERLRERAFMLGMEQAARIASDMVIGARAPRNEYERGWLAACLHVSGAIRGENDVPNARECLHL